MIVVVHYQKKLCEASEFLLKPGEVIKRKPPCPGWLLDSFEKDEFDFKIAVVTPQ